MFKLFFKGLAMGSADVVPGVSGGTLALILGIYPRLIAAVHNIKPATLMSILRHWKLWKADERQKFFAVVAGFDGLFLAILGSGIFLAIVIGSTIIPALIVDHTVPVMACFLGFIIPSVGVPFCMIKKFRFQHIFSFALGLGLVVSTSLWMKTNGSLFGQSDNLLLTAMVLFVCAMIAVCAMILPGISGSYILILLGQYFFVTGLISRLFYLLTGRIRAGKEAAMAVAEGYSAIECMILIGVVALGCLVGLGLFSRVLNWALKEVHDGTMAALTGMLAGSLYVLWPFKLVPEEQAILALGKIKWLPMAHNGMPVAGELTPALVSFGLSLVISSLILKFGKAYEN